MGQQGTDAAWKWAQQDMKSRVRVDNEITSDFS